ncbi:unnamed protein product [Amaranthus hypochondriacus]
MSSSTLECNVEERQASPCTGSVMACGMEVGMSSKMPINAGDIVVLPSSNEQTIGVPSINEKVDGIVGFGSHEVAVQKLNMENMGDMQLTNEGKHIKLHDELSSYKETTPLLDTCGEGSKNVVGRPSILHVGNTFHVGSFNTQEKKIIKVRRQKHVSGNKKSVNANCPPQHIILQAPFHEKESANKRKSGDFDVEMEEGDTELKRACVDFGVSAVDSVVDAVISGELVAGAGFDQPREEQ